MGIRALCLTLLTAGCFGNVSPSSPFDPEAPTSIQELGSIAGKVILPAGLDGELVAEANVHLVSPAGTVERTASKRDDGTFQFSEVTPGRYWIRPELAGLVASPAFVDVGIGQAVDVGELVMVASTGVVEHRVVLEGAPEGGHAGVRVWSRETGAQTETRPDGRFTLTLIARRHTLELLPPVGFRLPDELGELVVEIEPFGRHPLPVEGDLVLPPQETFAVRGRLTSPVEIRDWPARTLVALTGEGGQRLATVSNDDRDGVFEVVGRLPGAYELTIQVLGHLPERRAIDLQAADMDLGALPLRPEHVAYSASVLDPFGAPVAGALVRAHRGQVTADLAITGAAGTFTLDLTPETHGLVIEREGFEPLSDRFLDWDDLTRAFVVREGGAPPFTLRPHPVASLSGQVASAVGALEDWSTRASVALVSVDASVRRLEPVADADAGRGQFQLAGIPPGDYTLSVNVQGHVPWSRGFSLPQGDHGLDDVFPTGEQSGVALIDGEAVIVLDLEEQVEADAVILRGIARLGGRENHEGIVVRATIGGNLVATTLTDPNGTFAFVTSRLDHDLAFMRDGFMRVGVHTAWDALDARFEVGDQPLSEHVTTLTALNTASVTGQLRSPLTFEDWAPRAFVTLVSNDSTIRRLEPVLRDGAFQLVDLPPGGYQLSVSARGHLAASRALVLDDGNTHVEIDLVPETVGFSAVVHDRRGSSIEGVIVRAHRDDAIADTTLTDTVGAFALSLTSEDHTLTLSHPGYATHLAVILRWNADAVGFVVESPEPGEPPFVLAALPIAALSGFLQSPLQVDDWPERAFVTLTGDALHRVEPVFNAGDGRGRFRFSELPPGPYTVLVSARGHHAPAFGVELEEGENPPGAAELVVDLTPDLVPLELRAHLHEEVAHADITVRARLQNGQLVGTTVTDDEGRWRLALTPETHRLGFSRPGFTGVEVTLEWSGHGFTLDDARVAADHVVVTLQRNAQSDRDGDGVIDRLDNCPEEINADQADFDGDRAGDRCDRDIDDDGLVNGIDNCPHAFNPMQEDGDGNGIGVACGGVDAVTPFFVACRVTGQYLDTRSRPDLRRGSCGGHGAPELVYKMFVGAGDTVSVKVAAEHGLALYMVELGSNEEIDCVLSTRSTFTARTTGFHEITIDGRGGAFSAGPVRVDLQKRSCLIEPRPVRSFGAGLLPRSVHLADLDGDDDLDVAVAGAQSQTVVVFPNDGTGQLRPGPQMPVIPRPVGRGQCDDYLDNDGDGAADHPWDVDCLGPEDPQEWPGLFPFRLTSADVNSDGLMDLVTANLDAHNVSILRGVGEGEFEEGEPVPAGPGCIDVDAADLNGDGAPDLVTALMSSDEIAVLLNGEHGFGDPVRIATGPGPIGLHVADVTGDGELDVLVGHLPGTELSLHRGLGNGAIGEREALQAGDGPVTVRAGDFNEDSWPDVVATNLRGDSLTLLLGEGHGEFAPWVEVEIDADPAHLAVSDLDDDGHLDLAVVHRDGGTLTVLLGDGEGGFQEADVFEIGRLPHAVVAGDVDADGRVDLVVANSGDNEIRLLRGLGAGRFDARRERIPLERGVNASVTGDLNGDGRVDVVSTSLHGQDSTLSVVLALEDGGYAPPVLYPTDGGPLSPQLVDLDLDGHLDVVVAHGFPGQNTLGVRKGIGNGELEPEARRVQVGLTPWSIAVADFVDDPDDPHDDGALDLVTTSAEGVQVLRSNGRGDLISAASLQAGATPHVVLAGDMNRDGRPDVVVLNKFSGDITVVLNRGDGQFESLEPAPDAGTGFAGALADVNGDGLLDVLTANRLDDAAGVLLGRGDGRLHPGRSIPVGQQPQTIRAADFDRDGIVDLFTANLASSDVSFLRGLGRGDFAPARSLTAGRATSDVMPADLDQDGLLDLLTTNPAGHDLTAIFAAQQRAFDNRVTYPSGDWPTAIIEVELGGVLDPGGRPLPELIIASREGDDVLVLENHGGGELVPGDRYALEGAATNVTSNDFNGDGFADVAVTLEPNQVAVMLGRGDLTLSPPQIIEVGVAPYGIATADFDGNGDIDIATSNWLSGDVTLLFGRGDGNFEALTTLPASGWVRSIDAGDYDRNGTVDLATAGEHENMLHIYNGRGDGGFLPPIDLPTGGKPGAVRFVDVNGDEFLDVVYTNADSRDVRVRLNERAGEFGDEKIFPVGGAPGHFRAGDIDGDGAVDLVVAVGNNVAVMYGQQNGQFRPPLNISVVRGAGTVAVADLTEDGTLDIATSGVLSGDVTVLFNRLGIATAEGAGTRRLETTLADCDAAAIASDLIAPSVARFTVVPPAPCRVRRIELAVTWTDGPAAGPLTLEADLGGVQHPATPLLANDAASPASGQWRPAQLPGLARFEGSPARGKWILRAPAALDRATLYVNPQVGDPLDPEAPNPLCADLAGDDSGDHPGDRAEACRLDERPVEGTVSPGDRDLFLLEGPLHGGFPRGETIAIEVHGEADASLDVTLVPFGRTQAAGTARLEAPGRWRLDYDVPEMFQGRYLLVVVETGEGEGEGDGEVAYGLTVW